MSVDDISNSADLDDSDLRSYFTHAVERALNYYKLLFVMVCVFGVLEIAFVHTAKPTYTAVAAISPPKDLLSTSSLDGASGISSISRRLGIGGASTMSSQLFDEYTRVLKSYRLANALAQREDFLQLAFPDRWNPQTRQLNLARGPLSSVIDQVKGGLGLPLSSVSVDDMTYNLLDESLAISVPRDGSTDISEISFRFDDPTAAQKLLDIILATADALVRSDRRQDVTARVTYLQDQLVKVTLGDQKASIISLLMLQQNSMMMIAADHRYASNVVEPPHTPQKPTWPTLSSMIATILFMALVAWCLAIFFLPAQSRILAPFSRDRSLLPWRKKNSPSPLAHEPGVISRQHQN